jgi:phospholipid transport system transporter-binding protein
MREGDSAEVELVNAGAGRIQVRGALTFATARRARAEGERVLGAPGNTPIEIDCAAVTASDSSGLAVLLDWLVLARRRGRVLRFSGLPEPILAVAQISDVESYLNQGLAE